MMRGLITVVRGDWLLPFVMSVAAGAVDVIGFLALGGLFTSHITGNVVVVATHYATGRFCEIGPLLAVPVFVAVLGAVALASGAAAKAGGMPLRSVHDTTAPPSTEAAALSGWPSNSDDNWISSSWLRGVKPACARRPLTAARPPTTAAADEPTPRECGI